MCYFFPKCILHLCISQKRIECDYISDMISNIPNYEICKYSKCEIEHLLHNNYVFCMKSWYDPSIDPNNDRRWDTTKRFIIDAETWQENKFVYKHLIKK